MPKRIDKLATLPAELPAVPEQKHLVPERFYPKEKDQIQPWLLEYINKMTTQLRRDLTTMQILTTLSVLTLDDLKGLMIVSDAEFAVFQDLILFQVKQRILTLEGHVADLTARVQALENP